MRDQLTELLGRMAVHIAQERGWTIAEAKQYVKRQAAVAREEHRQAGAPYGDDDAGFVRWLMTPRRPVTLSA